MDKIVEDTFFAGPATTTSRSYNIIEIDMLNSSSSSSFSFILLE